MDRRPADRPSAAPVSRTTGRLGGGGEIEGASHFAQVSEPDIVAGVIRRRRQSVAADLAARRRRSHAGSAAAAAKRRCGVAVPPGQYVTPGSSVLSAGPTRITPTETWSFEIRGEVGDRGPGPGTVHCAP